MTGALRRLDRRLFGPGLDAYRRAVERELAFDPLSLLDVGCGAVSAVEAVFASVPVTVGIDAHLPTVEARRRSGPYGRYECIPALDAADRFGAASFDVAAAMDVVEHFDKRDGHRLLDVLEAVARRRVLVCTPNGYLEQGEQEGNPHQVHRSGWFAEDFARRGYRVAGLHGWRPLRGPGAEPVVRPAALGLRLSAATQPLVAARPHLAFHLLAVLDLDGRSADA